MALNPYFEPAPNGDTAFTISPPRIKFGRGALRELGYDAKALGMSRVALFTDAQVATLAPMAIAKAALSEAGIDAVIYDEVEVEPTDRSFKAATAFALDGGFDGYISVGGGSVMDTCKAANLYATHPVDDFLAYVNAPIGGALAAPGPIKPHIACPTTFGTASECTAMSIFDLLEMEVKTGIANPVLKPDLGIIDPDTLATLPSEIVAANAFDVFSHAIESYTALPYTKREPVSDPTKRPVSQGANPMSDLNCLEAIRLIGVNLVDAVKAPTPDHFEALAFSGMLAGIGFGNAGCHMPHAMSYAVAGLVRDYEPKGWQSNHPMVPHGISVIVNAPAVFRRTGPACPERHLAAAEAMGADISGAAPENAGDILAERVADLMRETDMPNGNSGVGYSEDDLDALTERTHAQQRLVKLAPMAVDKAMIKEMFRDSLRYW
ncbi:MAG: iron-containing alcohol dehydrogenase [Rhodospirillaceae bacterium]|jgi:hydroxyacid-oxoacid transhydrogenase|nr:iron-containing alcohol dehydrogenase [Rhodospirillaceae bacterium]